MLDVNTWSKFYWENEHNHWSNLAEEIDKSNPYDCAIKIAENLKKINNDYFQECAELSLGYYPTVETERKYKKLKKLLGENLNSINIDNFINQLKIAGEKGNLFFYYFEKQIELKNTTEIISKLDNYDLNVIEYLKNKIIIENDADKYKIEKLHSALSNHLKSMIKNESEEQRVNLAFNFFNKENEQDWFKNNLNYFLSYETFLIYIANAIESSDTSIKEITDFLNNNAEKSKLLEFNTNILAYIESFTIDERVKQFVTSLPLESYTAFKKIIFGNIVTENGLQKWYDLIINTEKSPKDFLEKVWKDQKDRKGMKLIFTIDTDSIVLDFLAEKMIHVYSKEELDNFDFSQAMITQNNLQEIMHKKVNYYYLSNKLSPNNKKMKKTKI